MLKFDLNMFFINSIGKIQIYTLSFFIVLSNGNLILDEYKIDPNVIATLKTYDTKIKTGENIKTSEKVIVKISNILSSENKFIIDREKKFSMFTDGDFVPEFFKVQTAKIQASPMACIEMVYKCSGNITLEKYIENKNKNFSLHYDEILELIRDIIIGLRYLYVRGTALGNLNIGNILTNENGEIFFIDFELAVKLMSSNPSSEQHTVKIKGPLGSQNIVIVSLPGDIYSFGIIMQKLMEKCTCADKDSALSKDFLNLYDNLKNTCLEPNIDRRITAINATKHKIFRLLLPDFYEFSHLTDFTVKTKDYKIVKENNTITLFKNGCRMVTMKEIQMTKNKNSIAIKNPEDFYYTANGTVTNIENISKKYIEYIKLMIECIKNVAMSSNPPLKIDNSGKQKHDKNFESLKGYMQSISKNRQTYKLKDLNPVITIQSVSMKQAQLPQKSNITQQKNVQTDPSTSNMSKIIDPLKLNAIPNNPQPVQSKSTPTDNVTSNNITNEEPQQNSNNNSGLSTEKKVAIGVFAFVLGSVIILYTYNYYKKGFAG